MTSVKILKIHKWWTSHYGRMMAFTYLVLAASPSPPPPGAFLATLGLFTVASLGIGSFGQLLNDLTDVAQDLRTGTQNLVARRGPVARIALFAAALAVGVLPWWWLPTTPAVAGLVAAEYLLFALYSLPPFRLKNRGILGPIADSLYGYVVPNTVVMLLFAELGGGMSPWLLAAIATWAFLFGLEQIVHHQLIDEARDRVDGIRTFAVIRGWDSAFSILRRVILPLEALAFAALLACIAPIAPAIPVFFVLSFTARLWRRACGGLHATMRPDRLPAIEGTLMVSDVAIARFTRRWMPILALGTLAVARPEYLPILGLQLAIFPEPLAWLVREVLPEARRRLRPG